MRLIMNLKMVVMTIVVVLLKVNGRSDKITIDVEEAFNNQPQRPLESRILLLEQVFCSNQIYRVCYQLPSNGYETIRNNWSPDDIQFQIRILTCMSSESNSAPLPDLCLKTISSDGSELNSVCSGVDINGEVSLNLQDVAALQPDTIFVLRLNLESIPTSLQDKSQSLIGCINTNKIPVFLVNKAPSRMKRNRKTIEASLQNPCQSLMMIQNQSGVSRCCIGLRFMEREHLTMWGVIEAPKTIPITFCVGHCYDFYADGTNNKLFLSYKRFSIKNRLNESQDSFFTRKLSAGFCCSAKNLTSFTMLITKANKQSHLKTVPEMLVTQCGCK